MTNPGPRASEFTLDVDARCAPARGFHASTDPRSPRIVLQRPRNTLPAEPIELDVRVSGAGGSHGRSTRRPRAHRGGIYREVVPDEKLSSSRGRGRRLAGSSIRIGSMPSPRVTAAPWLPAGERTELTVHVELPAGRRRDLPEGWSSTASRPGWRDTVDRLGSGLCRLSARSGRPGRRLRGGASTEAAGRCRRRGLQQRGRRMRCGRSSSL